ncbi:hypothetical protein AKJ37_00710 [candidate division MSBL1 archaeon SCGC-AAA259I09]|uniref:Uncharacterized protein n=1 Tax=candidate division MSBL1 archaeon SCGC-AAA259I09 TaxID=1698267 RepID=A0A133UVJ3_9EURY|nr:hypothetical protein AKJ37_00710 [candidate division MSBL1 archaeon SCGC-AAA259I09]
MIQYCVRFWKAEELFGVINFSRQLCFGGYLGMVWRRAYGFYRRKKREAYGRLRSDPLFQKFIAFIRWRLRRSLFPGYAPAPHPEN